MKIVIGITQYPEKIAEVMRQYQGLPGSATEVGPFLTRDEALAWLDCLKSKIGDIEEISAEETDDLAEQLYYGFTFERDV